MRYRTLTMSLAAVASGAVLAPQAAAGVRWDSIAPPIVDRDLCMITADPWDQRTYALEATVDGSVAVLIPKVDQSGAHFDARSWYFPAGLLTEVRWAWMGDRWGDTLPVSADCVFEVDYQAMPGKRDSVTVERVPYGGPPTTTTSTTGQPPPATTAPFTEQTVTVATPPTFTVDVPTPLDSTTSVPSEPTSSLPTVTAEQLPVTGGPTGFLAWLGLGTLLAGVGLVASTKQRGR